MDLPIDIGLKTDDRSTLDAMVNYDLNVNGESYYVTRNDGTWVSLTHPNITRVEKREVPKRLEVLYRRDPIVRGSLDAFVAGQCSYVEALETAVGCLSESAAKYHDAALRGCMEWMPATVPAIQERPCSSYRVDVTTTIPVHSAVDGVASRSVALFNTSFGPFRELASAEEVAHILANASYVIGASIVRQD